MADLNDLMSEYDFRLSKTVIHAEAQIAHIEFNRDYVIETIDEEYGDDVVILTFSSTGCPSLKVDFGQGNESGEHRFRALIDSEELYQPEDDNWPIGITSYQDFLLTGKNKNRIEHVVGGREMVRIAHAEDSEQALYKMCDYLRQIILRVQEDRVRRIRKLVS